MKSLYNGKKGLTSKDNLELARQLKLGDTKARQTMIEGNAGFAYKRAIKYAGKNRGWSHIDDDDILQSAMLGLIDAVDRYDPEKGFAFTTYAHFWIVKRIDEEISANHWNTMRPPRNMMRSFLYRKFDYEASAEYISRFMSKDDTSSGSMNQGGNRDDRFSQLEIDDAVGRCNLSPIETRVYSALYGSNEEYDDLSDMNKKEIADIEDAMLTKIRCQFE